MPRQAKNAVIGSVVAALLSFFAWGVQSWIGSVQAQHREINSRLTNQEIVTARFVAYQEDITRRLGRIETKLDQKR